jgi:hypothetical protein
MSRYLFLALAVAAALALPASATNLLLNGGFEDGNTGPISGDGVPTSWSAWGPTSGWHHDDAGRVIDTKAIKFWWDDTGLWQDVTIAPGGQYDFSVLALSASADPLVGWNGLLKAEFYNSALGTDSGHLLGQAEVDRFYSASDPRDQWVTVSGTVTAPPTADIARMILKIADWQSTGVGGSLNFDNASIALTPEPAAAVLGLVLVAALRRR